ncbi:alpha/beta fold hydrolase [Lentibacillus sp. Marseille-P4043]|uniref:alpha/beta fold hydrolase n=1 Tax=Lentibacillus sp. Marseille-P4043 TaxID=2040293 RepID=UPI000D0ACF99|nr:alpha/beta hydrolase [Lentibacillus sp. Marseille-P4043]
MKSEIITLENKLRVNVSMWGTHKPTIILLHGLGSTGGSFDELATMLSKNFKVMAFDLPGHGKSSFLNDESFFSMASLANWVKDVIHYYDVSDFHIAGHSVGGYIGLAFAKQNLLKSLILLDGGYIRASSLLGNTLEEEMKMTEQHIKNYTFSSWREYENELINDGLSNKSIKLSKSSMENKNDKIKLIVNSDAAKHIVKQKFYEPTKDTLTGIETPILMLKSTLPEDFNPVRNSETNRLKQYLNVRVIDVDDASHNVYWDKPGFISNQMSKWIKNQTKN